MLYLIIYYDFKANLYKISYTYRWNGGLIILFTYWYLVQNKLIIYLIDNLRKLGFLFHWEISTILKNWNVLISMIDILKEMCQFIIKINYWYLLGLH